LYRFTPVFKHIEEWSKTEKEKQMADVTIRATKNGPYLVRGPIELLDTTGNKIKVEKETIALCRCGGSTTKPFCDGTHSRIGFQAAEAAVEEADSK
jgi:CDGSH-type Zn-finger protein